jgi:hypothetical protein
MEMRIDVGWRGKIVEGEGRGWREEGGGKRVEGRGWREEGKERVRQHRAERTKTEREKGREGKEKR